MGNPSSTKITKEDVSRQFGKNARNYALSAGHASGSDLDIVLALLNPQADWKVLDVATGAGHTAALVAPHVASLVATDLAPEMIGETSTLFAKKGLTNVMASVMDVENLQFADESFDAVTCRIAPHHFIDVAKAMSEVARVLKPGGLFVMEDSFAPQARKLDTFINTVERMRDATHVRSYTKGEWREMLRAAGMRVVKSVNYRKTHDIVDWMNKSSLEEPGRSHVLEYFRRAPETAAKHYEIKLVDGVAVSYTDDKAIFKAIKS